MHAARPPRTMQTPTEPTDACHGYDCCTCMTSKTVGQTFAIVLSTFQKTVRVVCRRGGRKAGEQTSDTHTHSLASS